MNKTKTFPFAPGVIQRLPRRPWLTDRRVEQIAQAALALSLLATLVATLYLMAILPMLGGAL
jgi:hypothetical protein